MEKCKLAPKNGIDSSEVGKCYIEAQSCKETLVQRQLVGKKKNRRSARQTLVLNDNASDMHSLEQYCQR